MASLSKDGKTWRIRFVDGDGKRHGIRLPGLKKSEADVVLSRVKEVVAAKISNQGLETVTATWLSGIDSRLRKRLESVGLVNPPEPKDEADPGKQVPELKDFLERFISRQTTSKGTRASQQTLNKWRGTRDLLLECFDGDRMLDSFDLADGRTFREWMEQRKLKKTVRTPTGRMAENSMRQRMANCKTFFAYAVSEELVAANPFRNQFASTVSSDDGKIIIPAEVVNQVIETSPNAQWRLLIALWRYAGLRKMEPMELNWCDVLWSEGKLRVTAPKTRHHNGKDIRYVPIRDIEQYLREAFDAAAEGEERIISGYRVSMSNLHKPMVKIVEKAGIQVWPNLFKNLRMSCENDWLTRQEAPAHVIAAWMGHSVDVQNSHYAMVSDGHFEAFNESGPFRGPVDRGSPSQSDAPNGTEWSKSHRNASYPAKTLSKNAPRRT